MPPKQTKFRQKSNLATRCSVNAGQARKEPSCDRGHISGARATLSSSYRPGSSGIRRDRPMTAQPIQSILTKSLITILMIGMTAASMNISTASARQYDVYGAIAYSRTTGAHGFSYNYTTRSVAQGQALRQCESRSGRGDCRVQIWFRNACGVVAVGRNGAFGSGWGSDVGRAQQYAAQTCQNYGGTQCRVVRWACTDH